VRIFFSARGPVLSDVCAGPVRTNISASSTRCDYDCTGVQPNNIGRRLRFSDTSRGVSNTSLCEIIAYSAPALPGGLYIYYSNLLILLGLCSHTFVGRSVLYINCCIAC
jgi:hypothetical protein